MRLTLRLRLGLVNPLQIQTPRDNAGLTQTGSRVLACDPQLPRSALQSFPTRYELRFAVFAAIALLFAQLGAISHAYTHDAANSVGAHHSGANSSHAGNGHEFCNDCLAYAPLLVAGGSPVSLPPIEVQRCALSVDHTRSSLVDLTLTLGFRSRAPPDRA